jgi:hypothetical protein
VLVRGTYLYRTGVQSIPLSWQSLLYQIVMSVPVVWGPAYPGANPQPVRLEA